MKYLTEDKLGTILREVYHDSEVLCGKGNFYKMLPWKTGNDSNDF